jgi:hypothetical protein
MMCFAQKVGKKSCSSSGSARGWRFPVSEAGHNVTKPHILSMELKNRRFFVTIYADCMEVIEPFRCKTVVKSHQFRNKNSKLTLIFDFKGL